MSDQEFLVSFGVDIDEAGVFRLETVLEENRKLAEEISAAFDGATAAVRAFAEEAAFLLPSLSGAGRGVTSESWGGGGLSVELDFTQANKGLSSFLAQAKKPVKLSADASGIVSAARSALENVRSLFSSPVSLNVRVTPEAGNSGKDLSFGSSLPGFSSGGRFSRPSSVRVAEDGDAEYIIPVKKEERAVPLLRQLLGELSPSARESLGGSVPASGLLSAGVSAAQPFAGSVSQDNRTVSAPVNIHVTASGTPAEEVGQSVYDVAERYLLRTLRSAFPL